MMGRSIAATVLCVSVLAGCVQTGISASDAKDAYGKEPTPQELESALKKSGHWEDYQQIKARDAAVEAENRKHADPGLKQDTKNMQTP